MEEQRKLAIADIRAKRQAIERGFNDWLECVWLAGLNPTEMEFVLPRNVAFYLMGTGGIRVEEFIYLSDFGDVKVRIKDAS